MQFAMPEFSNSASAYLMDDKVVPKEAFEHNLYMRSLAGTSIEKFYRTYLYAFTADDRPITTVPISDLEDHHKATDTLFENSFGIFTESDELVGFCVNSVRKCENGALLVHCSGLALREGYRSLGLSKPLAEQSAAYLIGMGVRRATIEVETGNEVAISLYLKIGFKVERTFTTLAAKEFQTLGDTVPPEVTLQNGTLDPSIISKLPKMEYEPTWRHKTQSMINIHDKIEIVTAWIGDEIVAYAMKRKSNRLLTQIGVRDDMWNTSVPSAVLEKLFDQGVSAKASHVDASAEKTLELLSKHGFKIAWQEYGMKISAD